MTMDDWMDGTRMGQGWDMMGQGLNGSPILYCIVWGPRLLLQFQSARFGLEILPPASKLSTSISQSLHDNGSESRFLSLGLVCDIFMVVSLATLKSEHVRSWNTILVQQELA